MNTCQRYMFASELRNLLRNDFDADLGGSWLHSEGHLLFSPGGVVLSFSDVDVRCDPNTNPERGRALVSAIASLADAYKIRFSRVSVRSAQEMRDMWPLPDSLELAAEYLFFWTMVGMAELRMAGQTGDLAMSRPYRLTKFVFKFARNVLSFRNQRCDSYSDVVESLRVAGIDHPAFKRAYHLKRGDRLQFELEDEAALLSDDLWVHLAAPVARGPYMNAVSLIKHQVSRWYFLGTPLTFGSLIPRMTGVRMSREMSLAWARTTNYIDLAQVRSVA